MTLGCTASQILGQVAPIVRNKATQIITKGISSLFLALSCVVQWHQGSGRKQMLPTVGLCVCVSLYPSLCFSSVGCGALREFLEAMLHVAVCLTKPSTLNSTDIFQRTPLPREEVPSTVARISKLVTQHLLGRGLHEK